jgi:hypothetical protein
MPNRPRPILNYAGPDTPVPRPGWALYISVCLAGFLLVNLVFQQPLERLTPALIGEYQTFVGFCVVLAILVALGARWPRLRSSTILPLFAGVVGVLLVGRALIPVV